MMRGTASIQNIGRNATIRNVIVTFCALFWLVIYDGPLNHHEPATSEAYVSYIYSARLVLVLDVLTNNLVLYFVFRRWSFFLCYPCRKDMFLSVPGESSTDALRVSLLYDDESTRISTVQLQ